MTELQVTEIEGSTDSAIVFIVEYPLGEIILEEARNNYDIAQEALNNLILGGGITLPTNMGWRVHVINVKTGETKVIGNTE